ncbi:Crp/Fnr family transcriptional regulator [Marinoscillum furvescens]|uniref:CRP-like cAMP-binding protein n=1 Tax=Marinoscillum furvescens DSM 4134 TaxID=1122208 RepID=A0A3D9KZG5_MARFU|nr:Crp/Fnr family transcriptional regulator [Marinoscillum furvescens]RED95950.1 CRP-like cAMP-binding protein [Marinoscillum furvescens DSM 4134]
MSHALLKNHFSKHLDLTQDELEQLVAPYQIRSIAKGEYLLRRGDICRFEGFVTSGCLKISTTASNGEEKVVYFAGTDWWVMELDSFTNQKASTLDIRAIADSTLLLISHAQKEQLYKDVPVAERLFRLMTQKAVAAWQRRVVHYHTLTAEERYLQFLATYPDLAKHITNKQLASYLGITKEFLSVIRRRISRSGD